MKNSDIIKCYAGDQEVVKLLLGTEQIYPTSPGIVYATALTFNVPMTIEVSAQTSVSYSPLNADVDLVYSSSAPSLADIDNNGFIEVYSAGSVTFEVTDNNSQLSDQVTSVVLPPTPTPTGTPLTFDIISMGDIVMMTSGRSGYNAPAISIDVYLNGDYVQTFENNGGDYHDQLLGRISVSPGDKVEFYGDNLTISSGRMGTQTLYLGFNSFSGSDAEFNVYGSIMSIINSTGFSEITSLSGYYGSIGESVPNGLFGQLFASCTGLTDASGLVLPDDTGRYCYLGFMKNCTSLTDAPVLPAENIASGSYMQMFYNATNLTAITCMAKSGMSNVSTASTNTSGWTYGIAYPTGAGVFNCWAKDLWSVNGVTGTTTYYYNGIPCGWTVNEMYGGHFTVTSFDISYEANSGNTTEWVGPSEITNISVSGDLITNVQFNNNILTFDTLENSGFAQTNYIIATYGTGDTKEITVKKNRQSNIVDFATWFAANNYDSGLSLGNEFYISGAPSNVIWETTGQSMGTATAVKGSIRNPRFRMQSLSGTASPHVAYAWVTGSTGSAGNYMEAQIDRTETISGVTYGVYVIQNTTDMYIYNMGTGMDAQAWIDNIQPGELLIDPPGY